MRTRAPGPDRRPRRSPVRWSPRTRDATCADPKRRARSQSVRNRRRTLSGPAGDRRAVPAYAATDRTVGCAPAFGVGFGFGPESGVRRRAFDRPPADPDASTVRSRVRTRDRSDPDTPASAAAPERASAAPASVSVIVGHPPPSTGGLETPIRRGKIIVTRRCERITRRTPEGAMGRRR